jgi:hypothetical protein
MDAPLKIVSITKAVFFFAGQDFLHIQTAPF